MGTKMISNESGIVLVTVIVMTISMMILAAGMLSMNITQATSGESEVCSLKARALSEGAWWMSYMTLFENTDPSTLNPDLTDSDYNNKVFDVTINPGFAGSGPNQTDPIDVNVQYPFP